MPRSVPIVTLRQKSKLLKQMQINVYHIQMNPQPGDPDLFEEEMVDQLWDIHETIYEWILDSMMRAFQ